MTAVSGMGTWSTSIFAILLVCTIITVCIVFRILYNLKDGFTKQMDTHAHSTCCSRMPAK